jgi:hypothetical protein
MAKTLRPKRGAVTVRIRELEEKAAKLPVPSRRQVLQEIRKLKNQVENERWLRSAAPGS